MTPTRPAPGPRPPTPNACPVAALGQVTVAHARLFNQSLRQYHIATRHCRTCPTAATCDTRDRINAQIDRAIREIAEEWEL